MTRQGVNPLRIENNWPRYNANGASYSPEFGVDHLAELVPTLTSNLQILHLPITASSYKTTEGIPWTALAIINKKLPNLTSFHGYLNRHIYSIPDYTAGLPDKILPNGNVETLALGDGPISWDDEIDSNYLLRVGIFLYSLFPHLDVIIAKDKDDDGSQSNWDYIRRLVKMCQASSRISCPVAKASQGLF